MESVAPNPPVASKLAGHTIGAGRLKLVEAVGEGGYGVVYRAVEQRAVTSAPKKAQKQYAVKVLKKADTDTPDGECQLREIVIHKIVSEHPNVLTLHEIIEEDWFIYLVLDYCPGGDLYGAIVERRTYCQNDALTKSVFVQILDAVQSCHDKGIYHRDLKPDNIFVNSDDSKVLLGDFGLATDEETSSGFSVGSVFYMSPECIGEELGFAPYSTPASDVWALGIILTNMIAGRNPWRRATTHDQHFYRYMSDRKSLREMLPMSNAAADLLDKMFMFNARDRITIPELREEVLSIETFFLTASEVAAAKPVIKSALAHYSPRPAYTRAFAKAAAQAAAAKEADIGGSIFDDDPDDLEYIFASPDPNAPIHIPCSIYSSALSTSTTLLDDCESLFDELSICSSQDSSAPVTPSDTLADPMHVANMKDLEDDVKHVVPSWSMKESLVAFVRPSLRIMGLQA